MANYHIINTTILYRYETPSVWVVGLVLFLLAYCAIMAAGIWFYCKYCRGGKIIGTQTQENKIIESEIQSDQRAITYDEGQIQLTQNTFTNSEKSGFNTEKSYTHKISVGFFNKISVYSGDITALQNLKLQTLYCNIYILNL